MMYHTVIFVVVIICGVNAAFIINAADDALSLDSCYPLECDQDCRRIGFPGGVCVNGFCKCDINQPNEKSQMPAKDIIESVQLVLGDEGTSEENEIPVDNKIIPNQAFVQDEKPVLRSAVSRGSCDCIPYNCDKYCFRIRYIGGICVDGHCRCYK